MAKRNRKKQEVTRRNLILLTLAGGLFFVALTGHNNLTGAVIGNTITTSAQGLLTPFPLVIFVATAVLIFYLAR
jgi:hypothetical protein